MNQPTKYEFVRELMDTTRNGYSEPMTIENAQIDLDNFRRDGWNVPEDLTPEEYMEIWNELL